MFVTQCIYSVWWFSLFRNAYDCSIEDTEQPLLLHRPKQRRLPRGKDGQNVEVKLGNLLVLKLTIHTAPSA